MVVRTEPRDERKRRAEYVVSSMTQYVYCGGAVGGDGADERMRGF